MAVLEIQGLGEVEVGDEFLNLSPAEQQSFVDQVYSENVGAAPEEGGFFDRAGDVIEAGGRSLLDQRLKVPLPCLIWQTWLRKLSVIFRLSQINKAVKHLKLKVSNLCSKPRVLEMLAALRLNTWA
jgi:hypothetical protein